MGRLPLGLHLLRALQEEGLRHRLASLLHPDLSRGVGQNKTEVIRTEMLAKYTIHLK